MFLLFLSLIVTGAVIGALGRLVVPGPNPMGFFRTTFVGLGGAILGGIVGRLIFGFRYRYAYGLGLLIAVLCAAVIVVLMERPRSRPGGGGARWR